MADPVGNELLTVQGLDGAGRLAATTETFTLSQVGAIPSSFGGGTATLEEQGNINSQVGNPLTNPATITNDNVLAIYTLPANSFDVAGAGIEITAAGNLGNDSQAKRCKIIWNPATAVVGTAVTTTAASFLLGDTGSTTNAGTAAGWQINSQVFKYGANGSNTQIGQELGTIIGSIHGGMGIASALTTNEAAAALMCVTGNATSSVGDISLYTFTVVGQNY